MKPTPKPSGVWIAIETGRADAPETSLIGVFDTYDLAETACQNAGSFAIANIEVGKSYRGRMIDWRLVKRIRA